MIQVNDLEPCSCGSFELIAVLDPATEDARPFYACDDCGRDRTVELQAVPEDELPAPRPVIGPPLPDPYTLGILATRTVEVEAKSTRKGAYK